ncbi:Phenylacetic acid degradation operon negative regulatory protein paaX [Serratia entomophila]|nr:Phenylacetic acid degradation operon negative regulatory protein paaX [Serratia entomophila]
MAAPTHAQTDVTALLGELSASERVIYFRADYPYNRSEQTLQQLVAECWSLNEVAAGYHEFILSFRPLMALLRETDDAALTPLRCFQIKLLLIHFFRRVVLKDPLLPDALLPAQWEGQIARNLCINLYQRVDRAATDYVSALAESTIGSLPAPSASYYRRFGGLPRDTF